MSSYPTLASATREVVEGLLVFLGLHHVHLSRSAVKQLRPCLAVTVTAAARETPSGVDCTCNVKVSACGVGAYYLDAALFLNTLCEHGEQLKTVVSAPQTMGSMEEKCCPLSLLCRKIGEYASILSYEVEGTSPPSPGKLEIRESLVPRPNDFPAAGIMGTIMISVPKEALSSEISKLTSQLHLIHLINPGVCLSLRVADESSSQMCSVEYDSELSRTITNTPFSLATSLHHFLEQSSIPPRQSKLHMLRGMSYVIPGFPLGSGTSVSLKIYCTAAVVPHLPLRRGRKIPANKVCRALNISVFGPCSLPLLPAATAHLGFSLSELAHWENYGFRMKHTAPYTTSSSSIVCPSISCEVTDVRTEVLFGRTRLDARHTLQLFIFLEAVRGPDGVLRGATNQQWKHSMVLLHLLRGSFESLVRKHHKKFQQAIHSALNKVVCNYGLHTKASSALGTAIPLVSEAVASIVEHSSDSTFKEQCQELTQADGVSQIEGCVTQTLWQLAKDKLQLSHPSEPVSHVPDEPTTPEVIVAVSEEERGSPRTRGRRERRKRTVSNLQGLAGSSDENGGQLEGLSLERTDDTPTDSDMSVRENRESGSREITRSPHGGWSLFQAGVASKRSDRTVAKTEDHFDSLAAVDEMEVASESQHSELDTQLSVEDSAPLLQDSSSQADHSSGKTSPVPVLDAGSSYDELEDSMLLTQESCDGNGSFDELASFEMTSTQASLDSEQETQMDRDECGAVLTGSGAGVKVSAGVMRPDDYSSDSEWDDVALLCGHPAVSGLQLQPEGAVPPDQGCADYRGETTPPSHEDTLCVHQDNRDNGDSFDSLEGNTDASCDLSLTVQNVGSQPGPSFSPSLPTDCADQNSDSGSSEWENCADDIEKEWADARESDSGSWGSASTSLLPQRALQTSTDGQCRDWVASDAALSTGDCGESLTLRVSDNDFVWD